MPAEGVAPRSDAELPSLVAAQRLRAMGFGWTAAAGVLGAMALMTLGLALLVALASRTVGILFGALAAVAAALALVAWRRAGRRDAEARAKLDEAWERVAEEVLQARGGELTAPELARTMHTDETHAAGLLSRLSAAGRVRVAVRDDAELAYREEGDEAGAAPEAEPSRGAEREAPR